MKRSFHYILFSITVALAILAGFMAFHVNVNADMTKYLPDDSQMKRGLEIINSEFTSASQMSGADVHVMFEGMKPNEVPGIRTLLSAYPDVRSVAYRYSADSAYMVFDLDVPKFVDQKALGKEINNRFGGNCVVETSQDGATPPLSVMVIAAVMIMFILFVMSQSWFEPIVILLTAGLAIILNMGTNALLPSVSITTNFIGAILQATLSLDYCIVLLNRYRQEQDEHTDRRTAVVAANRAIKKAAPSILSSALTTVVGLLMLCFMRLKIGADMGIVLAKGVTFSLICTFTALPAFMMLFRRTINKTAKKAYIPPTDGLARFVSGHKIPIAIGAVLLFASSWFFARRTTIFFSAEAESQIEKIFPSPNPFVLVYDTQDEDSVYALVDGLMAQPGIQSVISYPTLMSQPLTPKEMTNHVLSLLTSFSDFMPEGTAMPQEALDALQPEWVRLVYYMRAHHGDDKRLTFPEVARFLHTNCANNPLFAAYIDAEMREQIADLQSMLDVDKKESKKPQTKQIPETEEAPVPLATQPVISNETIASVVDIEPEIIEQVDTMDVPEVKIERIAIVPFIERLNTAQTSAITVEMHKLTDTMAIRLPMTVNEMSVYMGSTPIQTRLVYGYAHGAKKLSPLQYVHLLEDDLFKRKGLAGMISAEQRKLLSQRAHLMDLADKNASLTPAEMNTLLRAFGVENLTNEELVAIANPPKKSEEVVSSQPETTKPDTPKIVVAQPIETHHADTTQVVAESTESPYSSVHMPSPKPSREDQQAELFTELVFGGKYYTPNQMAAKMARLMALSGVQSKPVTPAQMSLLYDYYGSLSSSADTLKVSLESLLNYLCDTLVYDPRLADVLPEETQTQAASVKTQLQDGLGQLRQDEHSLLIVLSSLPAESSETYAFVDTLTTLADGRLPHEHYYVGESVMYAEMRGGFDHEMNVVTLLTILAIFLIVALTFRSFIVPTILVVTVMTAVFVNVVVAGLISGQMLYLAYLIVQAILMGSTIDYGILFASYYRENRKTMLPIESVFAAYKGSIRTILTSGLIMIIGPGTMAVTIDDVLISNIVGCLAVGAFMAVVLTLTVLPAVLVALDKWVVYGKKNRFEENDQSPITNNKSPITNDQ